MQGHDDLHGALAGAEETNTPKPFEPWDAGADALLEVEDDPDEEQPEEGEDDTAPKHIASLADVDDRDGPLPEWVRVPKGMKFPKGKQPLFIRFRAELTDSGKERQCILWSLNDGDEKQAYNRSMGDAVRSIPELAKQQIRAVDGHRVDWTGTPAAPGNIERFWNDIGGKYRSALVSLYHQLHVLSLEERADFFGSCVVMRRVV